MGVIIGIILVKYKPSYKISINGEEIGYLNNKSALNEVIKSEILEANKAKNIDSIDINLDPNYELKLVDRKIETNKIEMSEDLENGISGIAPKKFPYPIVNNCLPHIDVFMPDGYTKEEYKMINETRKILNKPNLPITATCVRVPVRNCHSESINVEFEKEIDVYDIKILLQNSPGIILVDDIENNYYPIVTKADGTDEVYVGRIRRDFSVNYGINLWVVADNLRKGAATNAVQILEKLIQN